MRSEAWLFDCFGLDVEPRAHAPVRLVLPGGEGGARPERLSRGGRGARRERLSGRGRGARRERVWREAAGAAHRAGSGRMVKLTAELIEQAAQYTNAVRDRELDLRGESGERRAVRGLALPRAPGWAQRGRTAPAPSRPESGRCGRRAVPGAPDTAALVRRDLAVLPDPPPRASSGRWPRTRAAAVPVQSERRGLGKHVQVISRECGQRVGSLPPGRGRNQVREQKRLLGLRVLT